jgi:hypothetical protein
LYRPGEPVASIPWKRLDTNSLGQLIAFRNYFEELVWAGSFFVIFNNYYYSTLYGSVVSTFFLGNLSLFFTQLYLAFSFPTLTLLFSANLLIPLSF